MIVFANTAILMSQYTVSYKINAKARDDKFGILFVSGNDFLREHATRSARGCPLLQLNFTSADYEALKGEAHHLELILPEPQVPFPGDATCAVCFTGVPNIVNLTCGHASTCSEYLF